MITHSLSQIFFIWDGYSALFYNDNKKKVQDLPHNVQEQEPIGFRHPTIEDSQTLYSAINSTDLGWSIIILSEIIGADKWTCNKPEPGLFYLSAYSYLFQDQILNLPSITN